MLGWENEVNTFVPIITIWILHKLHIFLAEIQIRS